MAAYDYVIVGAGSAGCVLANKLSEDPGNSVLLLEAGPMDRDLMIHIPAGVHRVHRDPRLNWNYVTEPEPALDGRPIDMPRGKVVGGSSSINSMVYMRGHPLDYDAWAADLGLKGWAYADCLPYFKACEDSDRGADAWRGSGGPLGVTKGSYQNPLFDAFLEAGAEAGQGSSDDLNGYRPEGVARLDATKRGGRRCSAAVAWLKPALGRANLTLVTGAMVRRIVLDGARAVGLDYDHRGATHRAEAAREVLLCGGAINSAQTLMLSGIGPADHLRGHGITPVLDLYSVGANLLDHASIVVQYACTKSFPIHVVDRPLNKLMAGAQWLATRSGIAASNIWEAGGLVRGNGQVAFPNLQYHFGPVGFEYDGDRIVSRQAFALHVDLLRPRSQGRITLASADPMAKPLMQFNYLTEPEDMRQIVEGLRLARDLIAQPAFDDFRGTELDPGPDVRTDADIEAAIRGMTSTDFHPCGTCKMGTDPDAVVDGELRVCGIDGLRVVDGSVLPRIISANLNAPIQMIAARAADFILGRPQLPPETARFAFRESWAEGHAPWCNGGSAQSD